VLKDPGAGPALSVTGKLQVNLFDPMRIAARALVCAHPPVPIPDAKTQEPVAKDTLVVPHVLVVGFNPLGQQLVKQLIRVCHYPDCRPVRITVVSRDREDAWLQFRAATPMLDDVAQVTFRHHDPTTVSRQEWDELQQGQLFDVAYIVDDNPEIALAIAIDARDGLGSKTSPERVVVAGAGVGGLVSAVIAKQDHADWKEQSEVDVFDLGRSAWTYDYLVKGVDDVVASDIHRRYLQEQHQDLGDKYPNPRKMAHRPWEALPEYLRDANRDQADHIDTKLAVLRSRDIPMSELENGEKLQDLPPEQLEKYAEMEHRRWMASLVLSGFRFGKPNERKRVHKNLVAYNKLDDDTKKWDRDVIEQFPLTLQQRKTAESETQNN
jgi:hypothetical protein